MVAVGIMAVLACALFLVPYASAKVEITCSVYPEEAEFNSEFVYSITLTNPGYVTTGVLCLKVGSDSDNMDTTREWDVTDMKLEPGSPGEIENGKIRIKKGESCTVIKKGVKFTHPKLKQGAFRDWTKTKIPKWERAWYKCCFKPLPYGDEACCDDFEKPILTHCIEEFREHHVEQNEAYKDLSFDYSITVWANCEDSIELQVRNYNTSSGWDEYVLQNYTERDVYTNKTLTWHAVNLTLDNHNLDTEGRGHYKFVGTINNSQTYTGPTIKERFDKPKVCYNGTINRRAFDYKVEVLITMVNDDNIRLEVWNYSWNNGRGRWEPRGDPCRTTEPDKPHTLRWRNIYLTCHHFDDQLRGKFRINGTYKDAEFDGPRIEERFYNFNVTPPDGTWNDTFTYSVNVNATVCDTILLQVRNYTVSDPRDAKAWDDKGTQNYLTHDRPDTLVWSKIKLNKDEFSPLNDSQYRFDRFCNKSKSKEQEGPFWETGLEWNESSFSVEPERGLWNEEFNYCITMRAQRNLNVTLVVYKPSEEGWPSEEEIYNERKEYTNRSSWDTICFPVVPFNESLGDSGYKFIFDRKGVPVNATRITKGPYVASAKFEHPEVNPSAGDKNVHFGYSVKVNATKKGEVRLYILPPGDDDGFEDDRPRSYERVGHWETIYFNDTDVWGTVSQLGSMRYKFKFWGTGVKFGGGSGIFSSPELVEEKFSNFSVNPDEGNYTTCFNFTANLISSKPGNVPVTLQVSLDEAADDAYWEDVATKRYENDIPGSQIPINFTVCIDENEVTKNLASAWVNNKVIFWRVKGLVKKSITIPTTYDISLKWYNSSVTPEEGRWYDPFSFKVSLSAIENGTVALQAKLNGSDSAWQNRGKTYNYARPDQKSFTWLKETICSDSFAGNIWYRFEFTCGDAPYYSNKSGLDGPKLFIPLNISFTDDCVEDKEDVIFNKTFGGLFNETSNTFFNFSINVTANDTTAVDLILVDPDNNHHPERDYKIYTEPRQRLRFTWTRKELPLAQIENWCYTFSYTDPRNGSMRYNKTFVGPRIIAVFKNYTIDPYPIHFNRTHNVTVWMTGTIPMKVELEAFNLYKNKRIWEPVGTRDYEPTGEQPLNWTINTFDMPFDNLRLNWKRKENGE